MKTNLIALWCFLLFGAYFSFAQTTAIPDANFEQELIAQGIDSDGVVNGQALTQDLRTVTFLSVSGKNIADLTGIEAFIALEEMNVGGNPNLTTLDLSANSNLARLFATTTGLTSEPNFGSNTGLTNLAITGGNFSSINLTSFTALEELNLQQNQLTDILLGNAPNLTSINLSNNNANTLNTNGLSGLSILQISFNPISSLDLSQNNNFTQLRAQATQLIELDFSSNPFLATAIISNNPNLSYVSLKNDDRQDLSLLNMQSNPNLVCVEVDDLAIVNSNWIKGSQTTYSTGCFTLIPDANFEQQLVSANIDSDGVINGRAFTSDLANVTTLSLLNNIADYTGIQEFTSLQTFQVGGGTQSPTNVTLDLSLNTQLINVGLVFPGLTSLILPAGNTLDNLDIDAPQLTSLDVSQSTGITSLFLNNTALSILNVSNLSNLDLLQLQNSQVIALDLGNNSSLTGLSAANNDLQSLTVRTGNGINDITSFDVRGNPNLECIEVDDENTIPSGWQKDATASYSESCGPRPVFLNPPTDISSAYIATIEFDRAVTGFEQLDIAITGGALSDFQAISGTEYSVRVTPTSYCASLVALEIPANVAEDGQSKQNSSSGILNIATIDEDSPTVVLKDITIALDATGDASITGADIDDGSSDNCTAAADLNFSLSQFLFTCSDLGTNTINVLVDDADGNTQAGSVTITVIDDLAPTAIARDITVQLDASGNAIVSAQQIDNGSSDNCTVATLVLDKTNFTCADEGQNTVTLTVSDTSGNTDTATAVVTVEEDPNQPLTAIAQDITVQLDANGQANILPQEVDNGSGSGCGNISLSLDKTSFTCADLGTNTVTLTVTEGNTSETATATVTVEDILGPNLLLKDVTIDIEADGTSSLSMGDVDDGTTDNCSPEADITMILDITTFDCTNLGENIVTVTATDELGNTSTGTSIVTVVDTTAPTVITQDVTIALDVDGSASISPSEIDNGSSDACSGIASITLDISEFDCPQLGGNVVNLTVTDNDGNTATEAATVTITATDEDENGIADDCESQEVITPEGFSPNNDGINDTWVIENIDDFPNAKISVFNQWGIKVFETVGYNNDWNGTSNKGGGNTQLPVGAYLYILETNDSEFLPQQGWIYINY